MDLKKLKRNFEFRPGLYSFLNPYSYYLVRNKGYDVDGWFIDGILLVWILRLFSIRVERISFDMTSIAPVVFSECASKGLTLAIVGSEEDYVKKFVPIVREAYPGLIVTYSRNGFFSDDEERLESAREVITSKADVVIVGMGAIYQEKYLMDLKQLGFSGTAYSCGGFIHQTATGGTSYYPDWIDRFNIRWIYRIYDEPKLFKRYFIEYPIAVLHIMTDLLRGKLRRSKS